MGTCMAGGEETLIVDTRLYFSKHKHPQSLAKLHGETPAIPTGNVCVELRLL